MLRRPIDSGFVMSSRVGCQSTAVPTAVPLDPSNAKIQAMTTRPTDKSVKPEKHYSDYALCYILHATREKTNQSTNPK